MDSIDLTPNLVAFLLLLARIGDVGSTYLASPKMKLEANPVARRFKWPFAVLTIFAAAIPYYSVPMGVGILVSSLLVCASNLSGIWLVRTMGECEYHNLIVRLASQACVPSTLLFILAEALCIGAVGFLLLHLLPNTNSDLGINAVWGVFIYAAAIALWMPLAFLRNRREGKEEDLNTI